MRVAFLDQFSAWGGAQLCLADVMTAAAALGWQAELCAPGEGPLTAHARSLGFHVRPIGMQPYTNGRKSMRDVILYSSDLRQARRVFAEVRRAHPVDLIYVNGPRVLPLAARSRVPILFHSHSLLDKRYSRWIARLSLHSHRDSVLASSRYLGDSLRRVFPTNRIRVIYNGVPDLTYREPTASGTLRVGMVGRIAPEKGQLEFLQAVRLLQVSSELKFAIFGEPLYSAAGYGEQVTQEGQLLGVEFAGWRDPAKIYRDLDILALTSAAKDANPRVLMEAMAAGVCVVAYRSGGAAEIVTDGHDGLMADRNPAALADAVLRLSRDLGLRQRLAANARTTFEQRFTVPRFQREVCAAMVAALG